MFECQFCTYQSQRLALYLEHRKLHLNLSQNFHCGFKGCQKIFRVEVSSRSHLLRTHQVIPQGPKTDSPSTSSAVNTRFICSKPLCKEEFESDKAIIKHLKSHIRNQDKIECPFPNCGKEYSVLHSFTGHLSKKHKNPAGSIACLNTSPCIPSCGNSTNNDSCIDEQRHPIENSSSPNLDRDDIHSDTGYPNPMDLFSLSNAQMFLKLECQLLVPVSTLQTIVLSILNAQEQSQKIVTSNLETRLCEDGIFFRRIGFYR